MNSRSKQSHKPLYLICLKCKNNIPKIRHFVYDNQLYIEQQCVCKSKTQSILFSTYLSKRKLITPLKESELLSTQCPIHKLPCKIFCESCRVNLCEKCKTINNHKSENIREYINTENIINEYKTKTKDSIFSFEKSINSLIEKLKNKNNKIAMMESVLSKEKINEYICLLKDCENCLNEKEIKIKNIVCDNLLKISNDMGMFMNKISQENNKIKQQISILDETYNTNKRINDQIKNLIDILYQNFVQISEKDKKFNINIYQNFKNNIKINQNRIELLKEDINSYEKLSKKLNYFLQYNFITVVNNNPLSVIKPYFFDKPEDFISIKSIQSDKSLSSVKSEKSMASNISKISMNSKKLRISAITLVKCGYIAVALEDLTIKIFDRATFTCFKSLSGHTNHIVFLLSLCQKIDNKDRPIIISGSKDNTIKIWKSKENKDKDILNKDSDTFLMDNLSHKSNYFSNRTISCNSINVSNIYPDNISNNISELQLEKTNLFPDFYNEYTISNIHNKAITKLIKYTSNIIISSSRDKSIKFWKIDNHIDDQGKELLLDINLQNCQNAHKSEILNILLLNDTKLVSVDKAKVLKFWKIYQEDENKNILKSTHICDITGINNYSSESLCKIYSFLAIGGSKIITIVDTDKYEVVKSISGFTPFINSIKFMQDGYLIIAADNTIKIYDAFNFKCMKTIQENSIVKLIEVYQSANGYNYIVSGLADGVINFWGDK